jgi:hypothetical protein
MQKQQNLREALAIEAGKLLGMIIKQGGPGQETALAAALTQGMKAVPSELPPPASTLPFVTHLLIMAAMALGSSELPGARMLRLQIHSLRDLVRIAIEEQAENTIDDDTPPPPLEARIQLPSGAFMAVPTAPPPRDGINTVRLA